MTNSSPDSETRSIVLHRDKRRCLRCGTEIGFHTSFSIHHRRMRSHKWDGLNKPDNLITLCGSGTTGCHGWVHANPKEAYELGYLVHSWCDTPSTIPIRRYDGKDIMLDGEGEYRLA